MPVYKWYGLNTGGQEVKGRLEAASPTQLKSLLLQQKIALIHCYRRHNSILHRLLWEKNKKISQADFYHFFQHAAFLINSGVPLIQAIRTSVKQVKSWYLKKTMNTITTSIERGDSFSQQIKKYPNVFSLFIQHLIESGEKSGNLDANMDKIASYLERQHKLRNNIKQAVMLPMITLTLAFILIFAIIIFIIPQFEELFSAMDKSLPPMTARIIAVSSFFKTPAGLLSIVFFPMLLLSLKKISNRSPIKFFKDKLLLSIPVASVLITYTELINYLETFALTLKSGIPMKEALVIAQQSVGNVFFRQSLAVVSKDISHGRSIKKSFQNEKSLKIPEHFITMISVGERTGELSTVFEKAADFFKTSLFAKTKLLVTVIQPALLIVVGLIIGGLMLSVYLPIFNLANTL